METRKRSLSFPTRRRCLRRGTHWWYQVRWRERKFHSKYRLFGCEASSRSGRAARCWNGLGPSGGVSQEVHDALTGHSNVSTISSGYRALRRSPIEWSHRVYLQGQVIVQPSVTQFTSEVSSALTECGRTRDLRSRVVSIDPKRVEVALSSELAVNLSVVTWQS